MSQDLLKAFRAARRVSTPLVAIRTPDPAATMALVLGSFNGSAPAVLRWDIVNGLVGLNDPGSTAATAVAGPDPAISTGNPVEALTAAAKLPASSVLFLLNAHRFLDNEAVAQAAWNLRDLYKADSRTLVLLCPALTLPAELASDVLVLDEPLPAEEQLADIVRGTYEANSRLTLKIWHLLEKIDTSKLEALMAKGDYLETWKFIEQNIFSLR